MGIEATQEQKARWRSCWADRDDKSAVLERTRRARPQSSYLAHESDAPLYHRPDRLDAVKAEALARWERLEADGRIQIDTPGEFLKQLRGKG